MIKSRWKQIFNDPLAKLIFNLQQEYLALRILACCFQMLITVCHACIAVWNTCPSEWDPVLTFALASWKAPLQLFCHFRRSNLRFPIWSSSSHWDGWSIWSATGNPISIQAPPITLIWASLFHVVYQTSKSGLWEHSNTSSWSLFSLKAVPANPRWSLHPEMETHLEVSVCQTVHCFSSFLRPSGDAVSRVFQVQTLDPDCLMSPFFCGHFPAKWHCGYYGYRGKSEATRRSSAENTEKCQLPGLEVKSRKFSKDGKDGIHLTSL